MEGRAQLTLEAVGTGAALVATVEAEERGTLEDDGVTVEDVAAVEGGSERFVEGGTDDEAPHAGGAPRVQTPKAANESQSQAWSRCVQVTRTNRIGKSTNRMNCQEEFGTR